MRIISDHRDYYDSVQSHGQDQSCIWIRKLQEVTLSDYPFPRFSDKLSNVCAESFTIGFCGKVYPVVSVSTDYYKPSEFRYPENNSYCYNLEDIENFVLPKLDKKELNNYENHHSSYRYWFSRKGFKKFFERFEDVKNKYDSIFISNHCPVFISGVMGGHETYKDRFKIIYHGCNQTYPNSKFLSPGRNGLLKIFEFFKVFPSYQAYQEISMYLSGILGNSNPIIPKVSDKDLALAKGFDKFSFRKEKSKKKD